MLRFIFSNLFFSYLTFVVFIIARRRAIDCVHLVRNKGTSAVLTTFLYFHIVTRIGAFYFSQSVSYRLITSHGVSRLYPQCHYFSSHSVSRLYPQCQKDVIKNFPKKFAVEIRYKNTKNNSEQQKTTTKC